MTTHTEHHDFAHSGTMQAITMTLALLVLSVIALWYYASIS